jgi:quinol monooxygenase YgiN
MFIRVSYMHPKTGNEQRLREVLKDLSMFYRQQPGYLGGYILDPYASAADAGKRFGRVGLWEDEHAAERAAQQDHSMALRSELARIVEEDSHRELTFEGRPDDQ